MTAVWIVLAWLGAGVLLAAGWSALRTRERRREDPEAVRYARLSAALRADVERCHDHPDGECAGGR